VLDLLCEAAQLTHFPSHDWQPYLPLRLLERAIALHGVPDKITIDKSGTNTAGVHSVGPTLAQT
jgi:hypothetical protein